MIGADLWAKELFAHYGHESFILEDIPAQLLIGFSCKCSGQRLPFSTNLKSLKGSPSILQDFLQALREREKTPGTTWFAHQQARQIQCMKEMHWRNLIGEKMLTIDRKLKKKTSVSRRKKLKSQKHRLTVLLINDTIARSTKLYRRMVLNEPE